MIKVPGLVLILPMEGHLIWIYDLTPSDTKLSELRRMYSVIPWAIIHFMVFFFFGLNLKLSPYSLKNLYIYIYIL